MDVLRIRKPSRQIILSFSINSIPAATTFEQKTPSPLRRLTTAKKMIELGWRVRVRLDPIIFESGIDYYEPICEQIADIKPERVTVGTLRQLQN